MDSFLNIDTYSRLLTFAIFVLAGFDLSKSMPRPKSLYSWMLFILIVLVAGFIGMDMKLISVFGYNVYLNEIILGLCSGIILGFVLRMRPKFKVH